MLPSLSLSLSLLSCHNKNISRSVCNLCPLLRAHYLPPSSSGTTQKARVSQPVTTTFLASLFSFSLFLLFNFTFFNFSFLSPSLFPFPHFIFFILFSPFSSYLIFLVLALTVSSTNTPPPLSRNTSATVVITSLVQSICHLCQT